MSHDDDEDEAPKPQGRKARAKQAAEEAWRIGGGRRRLGAAGGFG